MTPYVIILVGTGTHHQGHHTGNPAKDADHHLKTMIAALQGAGHNIDAAAFIAENTPAEMLVGTHDKLPTLGSEKEGAAVTLDTLDSKIDTVLTELRSFVRYEKKDDKAGKPPKGGAKKEAPPPGTTTAPIEAPKKEGPPDGKPADEQPPTEEGAKKEGGGDDDAENTEGSTTQPA